MANYIITNNGLHRCDDDELRHYGVLGMKWGIHRAKKKGVDYTYRSHGQKKWTKKLATYKAKGADAKKIAKAKEKVELFKQRDLNRENFVRNTTVGKQILKNILLTPMGAGGYNRVRAAGGSRKTAYLTGFGSVIGNRSMEFDTARRDIERRKKNK